MKPGVNESLKKTP